MPFEHAQHGLGQIVDTKSLKSRCDLSEFTLARIRGNSLQPRNAASKPLVLSKQVCRARQTISKPKIKAINEWVRRLVLHAKDFHDFVSEVIDHLNGDTTG